MSQRETFKNYIENKSILIVGNGPSASKENKEWYDSFDIIVRCNNYKKIHSNRTDIFFSYFGRNIKKTKQELISDGVKFLINKCPNADMTESLKDTHVDMKDYRWIYDYRLNWWPASLVSFTKEELLSQIKRLDYFMPTVGFSAVLFFSQFVSSVNIIGFDCFESGISNLNEKWNKSGNHHSSKERDILSTLVRKEKIIWHHNTKPVQYNLIFDIQSKKLTLLNEKKFYQFNIAISNIINNNINGASAELGAYKGGASLYIAKTLNRRHYVFDTFEGIPNSDDYDTLHNGSFSNTSEEEVKELLKDTKSIIVKGWFTGDREDEEFCFSHFDGDTYESCVDFLNYFYKNTVKGGYIFFDDYGLEDASGVKKAVDEFLKIHNNHKKAFISSYHQFCIIK